MRRSPACGRWTATRSWSHEDHDAAPARFRAVPRARVQFGPGLTIVHGPNESGKSTLHAALSCLDLRPGAGGRRLAKHTAVIERHRPWQATGTRPRSSSSKHARRLRIDWDYEKPAVRGDRLGDRRRPHLRPRRRYQHRHSGRNAVRGRARRVPAGGLDRPGRAGRDRDRCDRCSRGDRARRRPVTDRIRAARRRSIACGRAANSWSASTATEQPPAPRGGAGDRASCAAVRSRRCQSRGRTAVGRTRSGRRAGQAHSSAASASSSSHSKGRAGDRCRPPSTGLRGSIESCRRPPLQYKARWRWRSSRRSRELPEPGNGTSICWRSATDDTARGDRPNVGKLEELQSPRRRSCHRARRTVSSRVGGCRRSGRSWPRPDRASMFSTLLVVVGVLCGGRSCGGDRHPPGYDARREAAREQRDREAADRRDRARAIEIELAKIATVES